MKGTKALRNQLNLSQLQMAQYLSITPSQLAMYETGRRDLSTAALIKLAELEIFINLTAGKTNTALPHISQQEVKAQKILHQHSKLLVHKQQAATHKLKTVQDIYNKNLLLLSFINHLKSTASPSKKMHGLNEWLNMIEVHAFNAIEQNGLHVQTILKLNAGFIEAQFKLVKMLIFKNNR